MLVKKIFAAHTQKDLNQYVLDVDIYVIMSVVLYVYMQYNAGIGICVHADQE